MRTPARPQQGASGVNQGPARGTGASHGVSAHLNVPSISCSPHPAQHRPQQTGCLEKQSHGGLCPRMHKLDPGHRAVDPAGPLLRSEGSPPPSCLQAPPLNPQPEPTGGQLPTPRPACPGWQDSAGPDDQPQVSPVLAAAAPRPPAGSHPLVPSGPQASFPLRPTSFPSSPA